MELSRFEKTLTPRSKEAERGKADIWRIQEAATETQRRKANHLAVFASAKERFLEKFYWTLVSQANLRNTYFFVRKARLHLYPMALLADRLENFLL